MNGSRILPQRVWSNQVGATERDIYPIAVNSGLSRASSRAEEVWLAKLRVDPAAFVGLWVESVASRLGDLLSLKEGWDSYGAPPVNQDAAAVMVATLENLDYNIRSSPAVSPTSEGGVLCSWSNSSYSIQLTSNAGGRVVAYFDDAQGEEWEGPIEDATDISKWLWQATAPSI